jgi:tetratricopeptide (TPR) repeat protein
MLTGLKQLRWTGNLKDRLEAWTSDRAPDHMEGERLLEQGAYPEAELCLAKAMVDGERRRLPNDVRIQIRLELGEAQRRQFRPEDGPAQPRKLEAAEETFRSALELARRENDKAILVQCLDALSRALADRNDLEAVEALMRETIQVEQHLRRPDALGMAQRLRRVASLRRQAGQVSDAIQPLEQAVQMFERLRGPDHPETADLLTELGDAFRFLRQHGMAQKHLLRALRIHECANGLESAEAVHDLNLLTASYESCGDTKSAADQHERVLGLKLRAVGADLEHIAEAQSSLAALHMRWGNPARARELLMEAAGTFKRHRGPRLAVAYEALASVEEKSGHLHDALLRLAGASEVWEKLQPAQVSALLRNLEWQAQILDRLHQPADAAFVRERGAAAQRGADPEPALLRVGSPLYH